MENKSGKVSELILLNKLVKNDDSDSTPSVTSADLRILNKNIEENKGTYGLYIKNMINGEIYEINSYEEFDSLSLYKIPLAYSTVSKIEEGELEWNQLIPYTINDYYNGFGTIGSSFFGTEFTLEKILELMLRESDNSAQQMLKNYLGDGYLISKFKYISGNDQTTLFTDEQNSSPAEISTILENMFYKSSLSEENKKTLLSFMYPTEYDNFISPYLKDNVTFYHKVGISEGSFHDCGIIDEANVKLVVCLMSDNTTEDTFKNICKLVATFVNKFSN